MQKTSLTGLKKLIVLLLSILMMITFMPSIAFATGSETDGNSTEAQTSVETASLTVKVDPSDANFYLEDADNKQILPSDDGTFSLKSGETYNYTVTKKGYVGQSGTTSITSNETKSFVLTKSTDNSNIDNTINSEWSSFRGNDTNMAIGNYATPTTIDNTSFRWAKKYGSGWGNAPSVQIIVDGKIVTMVNKKLYMIDPNTGDIVKSGDMVRAANWGYTPPTYADGMIFCPLANGTVQAFNAKTLESLWVYSDPLKGQSLSQITYSDGYLYTGFWNRETKKANYVCLSTTDEDPKQTNESKTATWRHCEVGGYYWAGSVVINNAVIFGTDDGEDGSTHPTSKLLSVDKKTGKVISSIGLAILFQ